jgi:glycosyltransferase involved in cell wall biosynthesis
MRVLFLTSAYPTPDSPAAGVFVREHALAAAEHADVGVLHLDRDPGRRGLAVAAVEGEPLPTWRVSYPYRPLPVSLLAHAVASVAGYRRAHFAPDLLHAHFFLAGLPAVALGRSLRKPVVVTEQWSIFLPSDPMPVTAPLRVAAKLAYEHAELVLPPSDALRRAIEAQGIDARFRIVPNVVDTRLFHPEGVPGNGVPRLLTVGLLYDAKGYEFLLEAAAILARGGRTFVLDVVGDGPKRAEYERLAAQLGLAGTVAFRGLLPKAEVAAMMREADAFVLASRYDNNPSALVEALVSGLPVVATDVGGIPELVDARSGLLARPQDAEHLAQRLAELLDTLGGYERSAIAAAAAARFGRDAVGRQLADAYAEAIELKGRR